jgi:hypothetical protein
MNSLRSFLLAIASLILLSQTAQAHYDPTIGRFINRDPIEEDGGTNLYGMVRNDLVDRTDFLGLETRGPTDIKPAEIRPCSHTFVLGHGTDVAEHIEAWNHKRKTPVGISYLSGLGCDTDGRNGEYGIPGTPVTTGFFIGINDPKAAKGDEVTNLGRNAANASEKESAIAFLGLVREQWERTLKHANEQAFDCPCECEDVTAVFVALGSLRKKNSAVWIYFQARQLAQTLNNPDQFNVGTFTNYDPNTQSNLHDPKHDLDKLPGDGTVVKFKCAKKRKY